MNCPFYPHTSVSFACYRQIGSVGLLDNITSCSTPGFSFNSSISNLSMISASGSALIIIYKKQKIAKNITVRDWKWVCSWCFKKCLNDWVSWQFVFLSNTELFLNFLKTSWGLKSFGGRSVVVGTQLCVVVGLGWMDSLVLALHLHLSLSLFLFCG